MKTFILYLAKKAKAICKYIIQPALKLKTVFGGRYIQQNINIEIKTSDNSKLQIVLKLKTVFGGKGQVQIITEIEVQTLENLKPKNNFIFNSEIRRLIH